MVPSLSSLLWPRKDGPVSSSSGGGGGGGGGGAVSVGSVASSIRLHKCKSAAASATKKGRHKAKAAAADRDKDKDESVVSSTTATATTSASTGSLGAARSSKSSKGTNGGRRRRRVQFLFDENDDVQGTWVENPLQFTDEEWARCFTVNAELRENRKRVVHQAALFGRENQLYVDVLHSILKSPLQPAPHTNGAPKCGERGKAAASAADTGVDLRPALAMDEAEILRVIGECPERGLEYVMSRDALFFRHKQYVINSILQRSDQLRRAGDQHGHPGKIRDARAEVLARFCAALTASSHDLARRLAQADELQARAIYEETNA